MDLEQVRQLGKQLLLIHIADNDDVVVELEQFFLDFEFLAFGGTFVQIFEVDELMAQAALVQLFQFGELHILAFFDETIRDFFVLERIDGPQAAEQFQQFHFDLRTVLNIEQLLNRLQEIGVLVKSQNPESCGTDHRFHGLNCREPDLGLPFLQHYDLSFIICRRMGKISSL